MEDESKAVNEAKERRARQEARHQLKLETTKLFSTQHGQLASIRSQLCDSVVAAVDAGELAGFNDPDARAEFVERQAERVVELLKRARSAFHYMQVPTAQDPKAMPFEMDDEAFAIASKDAAPVKEEDLRRARDMLWSHDFGCSQAWTGEQSEHTAKSFLNPYLDELRGIAADYCSSDDLASPTLEWALLDCLVHETLVEVGASYQAAGLLKQTVSGQRIFAPLIRGDFDLDRATAKSKLSSIFLGFGAQWLGKMVAEAVALAASAAVAFWITNSEGSSTNGWIVFTGMTAGRWIVRAIRNNGASGGAVVSAMDFMWRASQTYAVIPGMNAGLLRHLLYDLASLGARFHTEVFDILDKRLRRQLGF